jgi:hypothetical protein
MATPKCVACGGTSPDAVFRTPGNRGRRLCKSARRKTAQDPVVNIGDFWHCFE